jgi:hypothetical protein
MEHADTSLQIYMKQNGNIEFHCNIICSNAMYSHSHSTNGPKLKLTVSDASRRYLKLNDSAATIQQSMYITAIQKFT